MESLKDQISAYMASLEAKDSVVMSLANQLQDLESRDPNHQQSRESTVTILGGSDSAAQQRLQDLVDGYTMQNKFLNQEILELTRLRQDSCSMVDDMLQTCVKLETNYYDVHRKYVACLKELGKAQAEEESEFCI